MVLLVSEPYSNPADGLQLFAKSEPKGAHKTRRPFPQPQITGSAGVPSGCCLAVAGDKIAGEAGLNLGV